MTVEASPQLSTKIIDYIEVKVIKSLLEYNGQLHLYTNMPLDKVIHPSVAEAHILFGGPSIKQSQIITTHQWKDFIEEHPTYIYVFVHKEYSDSWKANSQKLYTDFLLEENLLRPEDDPLNGGNSFLTTILQAAPKTEETSGNIDQLTSG
jgi:hypothetical protein